MELAVNTVSNPQTKDKCWQVMPILQEMVLFIATLWGDLPLPSQGNTNKALSPEIDVYAQIISDLQTASVLLNGNAGIGYPKQYEPKLTRVYRLYAMDYWNMAYDEMKAFILLLMILVVYSLFKEKIQVIELQISQMRLKFSNIKVIFLKTYGGNTTWTMQQLIFMIITDLIELHVLQHGEVHLEILIHIYLNGK